MLKPNETLKKFNFSEKKNCKNFKYLEKIAKISSIWEKLQKVQVFGKNCRNVIILANVLLLLI